MDHPAGGTQHPTDNPALSSPTQTPGCWELAWATAAGRPSRAAPGGRRAGHRRRRSRGAPAPRCGPGRGAALGAGRQSPLQLETGTPEPFWPLTRSVLGVGAHFESVSSCQPEAWLGKGIGFGQCDFF